VTGGIRLVVVRHGATELTAKVLNGCGSGAADPPLTAVGLAQAQWARERLTAIGRPAAGVTSPARRARQTAEILGYSRAATAEAALAEVDFGRWEGLTWAEAHAAYPEHAARWWADPDQAPPGGTSLASVAARLRALIDSSMASGDQSDVAWIGHASTVRVVVALALGLPLGESARLQTPPAVVAEVRFWPDGGSCLDSVAGPRR
jgi:probable phosphoglycerate mutase